MIAYQGDEAFAARFRAEMQKHQDQDRVLRGTYGTDAGKWRGCAVGCGLRSLDAIDGKLRKQRQTDGDHARLAERLGIPLELVYLEDRIFESLPIDLAKAWPVRFANTIPCGVDLSMVWPRLACWLLTDADYGVLRVAKREDVRASIGAVAALYHRRIAGDEPSKGEWREARSASAAAASASNAAAAYADANAYYAAYAAAFWTACADKLCALMQEAKNA
jgi:hypothetical protein